MIETPCITRSRFCNGTWEFSARLFKRLCDARHDLPARHGIGAKLVGDYAPWATALLVKKAFHQSLSRFGVTPRLTIEITGGQWWWKARYLDPRPDHIFAVANDIHIPAGEFVELQLRSADVIHSFWVPSLAGKEDLIPGRENRLRIVADRPGVYRGQCAEFCGRQDASTPP